jgi:hypothetical protein
LPRNPDKQPPEKKYQQRKEKNAGKAVFGTNNTKIFIFIENTSKKLGNK